MRSHTGERPYQIKENRIHWVCALVRPCLYTTLVGEIIKSRRNSQTGAKSEVPKNSRNSCLLFH